MQKIIIQDPRSYKKIQEVIQEVFNTACNFVAFAAGLNTKQHQYLTFNKGGMKSIIQPELQATILKMEYNRIGTNNAAAKS